MNVDFNVWAAARTLKGKLGLQTGFRIAQGLNPSLTEDQWRAAVAEARQILRNKANEVSRNLSAKPKADEILPFRVNNPGGYFQQFTVYVLPEGAIEPEERPFTLKVDELRVRFKAARDVWDIFQAAIDENPEQYRETILSVSYTGTYELLPKV